ncbi:MarR family winged helix-turn-helix transcriptional regulator [Niallia sp. 01092]|uniref:MarR family winged helix-turn-helix transcriptional regulator n=1 Tax=unclassified Niallia TaxID=2837522 RepID=UPI003FD2B51F
MEDLHRLFHSVHQLARELTKELNEALQPFELYSSQWSVLYLLKKKGPLTQKELSDYLAVEAPPMTRTIQKLVAGGYVLQVKGEDKRTKYIILTEKALLLYPKWEEAVLQKNQQLLDNFPHPSPELLTKTIIEWTNRLKTRGKI